MSVILLADDSLHALRMGERILQEEGYQVVSLPDGLAACQQLSALDPDVVLADVFLPGVSGFDLCRYAKNRNRHVRVVLTAGQLEKFDEGEARRAGADNILRKPFEASMVRETVRPLSQAAQLARGELRAAPSAVPVSDGPPPPPPPDPARVRAAVALALEAAMPQLIDEITEKVLLALGQ
jgi:CheY-like chemotaxis protein